MTSIESAAIAMMATIAIATSTMVTPCSRRSDWHVWLNLRKASGFMSVQFSFIATDVAVIVVGRNVDAPKRLATFPNRQG